MLFNILFFTILCLAAFFDIKTRKIPNELVLIGIVSGLLFTPFSGLFRKLLGLLFVFAFGYFRLMGMGDIKLWMVVVTFVGFTNSCFIIAGAAALFILYSIFQNPSVLKDIRRLFLDFLMIHKIDPIDEKGMPFAPFVLLSSLIIKVVS